MARSHRKPTGRPRALSDAERDAQEQEVSAAQVMALYGGDAETQMQATADGVLTLEGQWLTAVTDPRWDINKAGPVRVGDVIAVKPAHRILVWDLVCTDVSKADIAELLGISVKCLETHFAFELKHAYNLMKVKTLRSVRRSADVGNMTAAGMILKDHNKANWRAAGKTPAENESEIEAVNEYNQEFVRSIRDVLFEAASMTNSQRQSARKKAA